MSKYTTELRFICEMLAGMSESSGYNSSAEIIETARPKIFDFDFPIFDESYRATLETKILKHFYTREICEETVGLWKLRLDSKLNEIMPYFNKLYSSELYEFNPLYMTDLHTVRDIKRNGQFESDTTSENSASRNSQDSRTSTGSRSTENNSVNDDWQVYSETPQGSLSGVESETYLTNATHSYGNTEGSETSESYSSTDAGNASETSSGDSSTATSSTENNVEAYVDHVYGYAGYNPAESIMKFRSALLNIDMQIIEELKPLFFNLW